MAEGFPLGVAIANEFANIVALLNSRPQSNLVTLPPAPTSAVPQPPLVAPTVASPPTQPPPASGAFPLPANPTIDFVTPVNNFGSTLPGAISPCPVFTPSQYAQLLAYQNQAQQGTSPSVLNPVVPVTQQGYSGKTFAVGQFLEASDFFQFTAYSSSDAVTVSFYGRIEGPDGSIRPFNYTLLTTTNGALKTAAPATGPGFLLNASASIPPGTTLTGSVNALGMIGRNIAGVFTPHTLLFSGQVSSSQPLSSTLASPAPATSNAAFFTVTSASGGVTTKTITVTPSAGRQVRILSANCFLQTSATAGSRGFSIAFQTSGTTRFFSGPGGFMHASETAQFFTAVNSGQQSYQEHTAGVSDSLSCSLPENLYFNQAVGVRMRYDVSFAGDDLSNMFVDYEES